MKERLPSGAILRVTVLWDNEMTENPNEVLKGTVTWAAVVKTPEEWGDGFSQVVWADDRNFGHNAIEHDADEYEIIPEDDVPGEVWATFARQQLLARSRRTCGSACTLFGQATNCVVSL